MKGFLAITALVITMAAVAFAQTPNVEARHNRIVEQELKQLDREWGMAVVRHDVVALDRLLADDYTLTGHPGEVIDKAQEIAASKMTDSDLVLKSYWTEDISVRVAGERATVTGRAILEALFDEQEFTSSYWYSRTFAKRQGRWQIITAQMIDLPE